MTKTILLADDSLTIQKVVELTFADTQYHVVSMSSGDELLGKLEEVQPELVICDIIMPGLEGYDVCQQIKSNPATLHIPVILLSGTFEPFDRDRALAAGCSEIITKPFEAKRLVDAVEKLLSPANTGVGDDIDEPESFGFGDASQDDDAASGAVDFGTQMATADLIDAADQEGAETEDGIDFTTSGFAEMEAAAEAVEEPPAGPISDGLDLSQDDTGGSASAGPERRDDLVNAGDEDFADAFSIPSPSFEVTAPVIGADRSDPFGSGDELSTDEGSPLDGDDPFEKFRDSPDDDLFEGAGPAPDAIVEDRDLEPDFEVRSAEEAFEMDPRPVVITDADTAPVASPPEDATDSEQPLEAGDDALAQPTIAAGLPCPTTTWSGSHAGWSSCPTNESSRSPGR